MTEDRVLSVHDGTNGASHVRCPAYACRCRRGGDRHESQCPSTVVMR